MISKVQPKTRRPGLLPGLVVLLLALLFWILFVGGVRQNEIYVGLVVTVIAGAFAYQIWLMESIRAHATLKDIAQAWRIPWYLAARNTQLTRILAQDLLGRRAKSFYRVCGFPTSNSDPHLVGRRVLATLYTTVAPNFIIIGIDFRQSRMLFHQLERSGVSIMTKALGATPGAKRL